MSKYVKQGNAYFPHAANTLNVADQLPVGTYSLKFHPEQGFYFEIIDDFQMPEKLYGDLTERTNRIVRTFDSRPFTTGVLLSGEKGSGKTLLAKNLAIVLAKAGIPTVVVNFPFQGDSFNTLIQNMTQPVYFLFDEFEKVYNTNEDKTIQDRLLTLLDGVYASKKLFVLTTNDSWRINEHMKNRPGRLFYLIDYQGLDPTFVREYAEDNLLNKGLIDQLVKTSLLYKHFNFDMLKAIVEEMNRYDETPKEVLAYLNARPDSTGEALYDIKLFVDGIQASEDMLGTPSLHFNPLAGEDGDDDEDQGFDGPGSAAFEITFWKRGRKVWDEIYGAWRIAHRENPRLDSPDITGFKVEIPFGPKYITKLDLTKGTFVFEREFEGVKYGLVLTERKTYTFDYYKYM